MPSSPPPPSQPPDLPERPDRPEPAGLPEPPGLRVGPLGRAPVDEERIGDRDLGQWPTRTGRRFVALVTRVTLLVGRVWRWSLANLALLLTVGVGGLLVLGATALAGEVYDEVADGQGVAAFDQPVLDASVASRTPTGEVWVTGFTDLGGKVGMPVIAVLVVVVLTLTRRSWLPAVLMVVAAAGSVLMTVLGKDLVGRARPPAVLAVPPLETSPSFPSGHTLNATVVLGIIAYLLVLGLRRRRARVAVVVGLAALAVAMGLSRVWLGHHWLTDVLAGWLVGLAWLGTVVTGHRVKVTLDHRHRATGPGDQASSRVKVSPVRAKPSRS